MAAFPNLITRDNFPKAWRYVCLKYKASKVRYAIRKYALPIGQLLFFPAFLILAFGAAYSFTPPTVQALIGKVPFLPQLWLQLKEALFGSSLSLWDSVFRAAGFLYLLPLGAFLIAALVTVIVYHPKTPAASGNINQDAEALWTLARHAQMHARIKERDFSGTLSIITGILAALGSLAVVLYWLLVPGGENVLTGLGVVQALQLFGLAIVLIFSYGIVVLPLTFLMRLVHWCPIPTRMVETAEIFCRGLRKAPSAPEAQSATPAQIPQDSAVLTAETSVQGAGPANEKADTEASPEA